MRKGSNVIKVFWLITIILLYLGCNVFITSESSEVTPSQTSLQVIVTEYTALPPVEPTATVEIKTLTETLVFTREPTLTSTVKPTWTPVPTLSNDSKKSNLLDLFLTNRGCLFPCWWGIQPGAPIQKAFELSPILGENPSMHGSLYSYNLGFDELNLLELTVTFFETNEIIQKIEVNTKIPFRLNDFLEVFEDTLSLSSILNHYGEPTIILLRVVPRAEKDSPIRYTLLLIYESRGFGIEYEGTVNSEDPILICPRVNDYHLEYTSMYLQDPRAIKVLGDSLLKKDYKRIEMVTSMSLESFYEIFSSDETTICIETTPDLWR
jgi:hypothetical protein